MTDHDNDTLGDIDHTHPIENRAFGSVFQRGPAVAADGGRRESARDPAGTDDEPDGDQDDRTEETTDDPTSLGDISHTPPDGDGANRVWDGTQVHERDSKGEVTDDE